jgi:hypothetical protein
MRPGCGAGGTAALAENPYVVSGMSSPFVIFALSHSRMVAEPAPSETWGATPRNDGWGLN